MKTHVRREGAVRYTRCGHRVPLANLVEANPSCNLCRAIAEERNGPPRVQHMRRLFDMPGALCGRDPPAQRLVSSALEVTCAACRQKLQALR